MRFDAMARKKATILIKAMILGSAFFMQTSVSLFGSSQARAESATGENSLRTVQKHLLATRAGWRAGQTSVSDLPRAERQLLLGASLSDVRTDGAYGKRSKVLENALPEGFDWRNFEGQDFVSPVKNQGRCGSCVAFAAASTFETQLNILSRSKLHAWSFSPQHLFSCGGGSCASGWFPGSALDHMVRDGIPEEACFPYTSGALGKDQPCKLTCSDAKLRSVKAIQRARNKRFKAASVDEVKQALLGGPLMTTMRVYDDFYLYTRGVYRYSTGALLGGHAVMILGWSNADQAWIARNSWGTDWGEEGDFRIAWDDMSGVGSSYYGVSVVDSSQALILEGIRDRQTVSQATSLSVRRNLEPVAEAVLEIRGTGKGIISKPFNAAGQITLSPQEFPDGVYTLQARASTGSSLNTFAVSQARLIYIRNSPQTATIKIDRMKEGMNVWESLVPQFVVSSQPTPLKFIQYRVFDSRGAEVRVRRTEHTADRVGMSLSPRGLEKGKHTIVAEAISDEGNVLASDSLTFNIIDK